MSETKPNIDKVINDKLKELVTTATSKFLGVKVQELNKDISSKLTQSSLVGVDINTDLDFKQAKKRFKRDYLKKLLQLKLGNISEVARLTKTNRRSVHRLINEFDIDVNKIKKDLLKPYNLKVDAVSHAIEEVLDDYKQVIHPEKLEDMYNNVEHISEDIIKELPEQPLSLKDAEQEFEKRYLLKVLTENNHNISLTAKSIGLRYETLHRKLKSLGLI